jgi:D-sedoheptulose 7-phosphate isomerase
MNRNDRADAIRESLLEGARLATAIAGESVPALLEAADRIAACLAGGHRVLLLGNGGSAADAQHMAGELVGRFEREDRRPCPVLSLTSDSSVLTAIGNDYGFAEVFARQVEAHATAGDVLLCFSTSGESENVIRAVHAAKERGVTVVGFLGGGESTLAKQVDHALRVPSRRTCRIQEGHIAMVHVICEELDRLLSGDVRS